MIDFSHPFEEIANDFQAEGIDASVPGFYDHPAFVQIEERDPNYLSNYARFVDEKSYEEAYIARANLEIPAIVRVLHEALTEDGRQGACVDISMLLSRCLEREGFWNYVMKGSLTITFPARSGLGKRFFYSVDKGKHQAGHVWVCAPPFRIVDLSLSQQGHSREERALLPDLVCEQLPMADVPLDEDLIAPEIRALLPANGVLRSRSFEKVFPHLSKILKFFPTYRVSAGETRLKFVPSGISAPDVPLEQMTGISAQSERGLKIYQGRVVPALQQLRQQ